MPECLFVEINSENSVLKIDTFFLFFFLAGGSQFSIGFTFILRTQMIFFRLDNCELCRCLRV